jgi:hypothetical protein
MEADTAMGADTGAGVPGGDANRQSWRNAVLDSLGRRSY